MGAVLLDMTVCGSMTPPLLRHTFIQTTSETKKTASWLVEVAILAAGMMWIARITIFSFASGLLPHQLRLVMQPPRKVSK